MIGASVLARLRTYEAFLQKFAARGIRSISLSVLASSAQVTTLKTRKDLAGLGVAVVPPGSVSVQDFLANVSAVLTAADDRNAAADNEGA